MYEIPFNEIMDYEAGELTHTETVELFGKLVRTGLAWKLQGHYGRTAHRLIEAGFLSPTGEVLRTEVA